MDGNPGRDPPVFVSSFLCNKHMIFEIIDRLTYSRVLLADEMPDSVSIPESQLVIGTYSDFIRNGNILYIALQIVKDTIEITVYA